MRGAPPVYTGNVSSSALPASLSIEVDSADVPWNGFPGYLWGVFFLKTNCRPDDFRFVVRLALFVYCFLKHSWAKLCQINTDESRTISWNQESKLQPVDRRTSDPDDHITA